MIELKAITSGEIYNKIEYEGSCITDDIYYPKAEADKVIAELKEKINEAQTELELWRDGSIISEAHQKELDEKRHSDYKRCLAMAMWCDSENYTACWYHENSERCKWTEKWRKRWLELAEKFKPNKEVNNA